MNPVNPPDYGPAYELSHSLVFLCGHYADLIMLGGRLALSEPGYFCSSDNLICVCCHVRHVVMYS